MNTLTNLFSFWLVSLLFDYDYFLSFLNIKGVFSFRPDRIIFIVIFIVFIFNILTNKLNNLKTGIVEYLMIGFTIICTLSYILSDSDIGLESHRWLATLFNIAYFPFLSYYIVKNMKLESSHILRLVVVITCIGVYISINGLFEHYRMDALVWPNYIMNEGIGIQWERLRGPFISSVVCGAILVVIFLNWSILYTIIVDSYKRFIIFLFMCLNIVCVYFTYTRSIWLALFAVILFLFFFKNDIRKPLMVIFLIVLIATFIGIGSKLSIFSGKGTLFSERQNTIDYRMINYRTAYKMFKDKPLFGIGYGKFLSEWENYISDMDYAVDDLKDGNHNYLLGLLAETGIVSVIIYLLIYIIIITNSVRCYRRLNENYILEKNIFLIVFAMVLEAFIIGITSDLRFHPLFHAIIFIFLGIATSLYTKYEEEVFEQESNNADYV